MKTKLELTIDSIVLARAKRYADAKGLSVSKLAENYLKKITMPSHRKSIIELIDELPKPAIPAGKDLKKAFYEDH